MRSLSATHMPALQRHHLELKLELIPAPYDIFHTEITCIAILFPPSHKHIEQAPHYTTHYYCQPAYLGFDACMQEINNLSSEAENLRMLYKTVI